MKNKNSNSPQDTSSSLISKTKQGCGKKVYFNEKYGEDVYCGQCYPENYDTCLCPECEKSIKEVKTIILDNNEISIAKYAEEYPENWKAMTDAKSTNKVINNPPEKAEPRAQDFSDKGDIHTQIKRELDEDYEVGCEECGLSENDCVCHIAHKNYAKDKLNETESK